MLRGVPMYEDFEGVLRLGNKYCKKHRMSHRGRFSIGEGAIVLKLCPGCVGEMRARRLEKKSNG